MIKSDFEMIARKFPQNKDLRIYAVGDLHAGAIQADLKGWERFNQIILDDPFAYVIFLGDLLNNATKSSVSNVYEDIMRPRDQKIYLKEHIADLAKAERILAILPGNHENRSLKEADDSPLFFVADSLGLTDIYRDNIAIIKLTIGSREKAKTNCYTLFATHGSGGGGTTGAYVNKCERYAKNYDGVDIFFFGHSHRPFVTKPNRIIVDANREVTRQRKTIVTTGSSWMAYGGYPVVKMLDPADQADPDQPLFFTFSGKRNVWKISCNW